jgi:hypothetical protein
MTSRPSFPTLLHQDAAELVRDYFRTIPNVDSVLVVNSCARGQAVPESDLDFAILAPPPIVVTSAVSNPICGGEGSYAIDLTVSGGKAPYGFLWSNGATS